MVDRVLSIGQHNIPFAYDVTSRIVFRAINVCVFLEYANTKQAILQHTTKEMRVDIVFDRPGLQNSNDNQFDISLKSKNEDRLILHGDGFDLDS